MNLTVKSYNLKVPTLRSGSRLHVGTNEARGHARFRPPERSCRAGVRAGFTLIEIMVSVSLFAIVAVIVSGALVTISDVNRKAQAIKLAMDNVSFAMDSMSRNLSDGQVYHCIVRATPPNIWESGFEQINTCSSGDSGVALAFQSKSKIKPGTTNNYRKMIYRFVKATVNEPGKIEIWQAFSDDPGSFVAMTAPEVDIEDMKFYVFPAGETEFRILMTVRGSVKGKSDTEFNLQTTIKSR